MRIAFTSALLFFLVTAAGGQDGEGGAIYVSPPLRTYEGACPTQVSFLARITGPKEPVEFYWVRSDGTKTDVASATVPFDTEDRLLVGHSGINTSITDVFHWRFVKSNESFRASQPAKIEVMCTGKNE